jgi:transposase-like protein
MHTKLIRKQVLFDEKSLKDLNLIMGKSESGFSFSKYLRNLIEQDLQKIKQKNQTKKSKLLTKKGFLKTKSIGTEAINHNDIYKI